ncbi:hypothetical protein M2607_27645 [Klebsiella pneumoniae]|nr:hypothetical protein [Klebsiella pneumoniae]
MRDLILQLSKSSIYSTKPVACATLLGLTGHEVLAGTVIGTVVAVAGIFVLRQKPSIKKKSEDNKPEEK